LCCRACQGSKVWVQTLSDFGLRRGKTDWYADAAVRRRGLLRKGVGGRPGWKNKG
jgi:hypothetical protein